MYRLSFFLLLFILTQTLYAFGIDEEQGLFKEVIDVSYFHHMEKAKSLLVM